VIDQPEEVPNNHKRSLIEHPEVTLAKDPRRSNGIAFPILVILLLALISNVR
jgi:hypothetical protein